MNESAFNQKGTINYLAWTFGLAWVMQIAVAILYQNGMTVFGQLLMCLVMFTPLLGVVLSKNSLRGMGWKPIFKGNDKIILMAWFLPMLLTAIGAALYFFVFPEHFDLSGEVLVANGGIEMLQQLEAQGLDYSAYVLTSVIGCLTYVPLSNMLFAIGEEVGWRGFLYPQMKAKFGKRKGWLISGVIWGIWHWPLIWLIGYEYGTDYVGFPVVGMLIFCIFTVAAGILCDWLYEKSKCIWIPSVFHGTINAAGTLPLSVCITNIGSCRLLGPAPIGVLAGVPFILLAIVLWCQSEKQVES